MASVRIAYEDRKEAIREILKRRAVEQRTIYYGELGQMLGIPARGPWKPILDQIGREEIGLGLPDVTYLVVNKQNDMPGQIGFKPAKPPTEQQIAVANETIKAVFKHYKRKR